MMGLLTKKSDKQIWAENEIKKYDSELAPILGSNGVNNLKSTVASIAENQGFEEALAYIEFTRGRVNYYKNKQKDYMIEAKLADNVYKSYVTDGVSRLEKINGRFMASQNMKLDLLIEQNNRIIQLLEKIAGESADTDDFGILEQISNTELNSIDDGKYCPTCNSIVEEDSKFCTNCGEKID